MKHKRYHTLQGKLMLLVSMIVLTSLLFFFGNFYTNSILSREYTMLIEQNQLMPQYTKALAEYYSALQKYSNMSRDSRAMEEYTAGEEKLVTIAADLYQAFPDPYLENLFYLSENLSGQGRLIITETKNKNQEAVRQAYEEFSWAYSLLNKYILYVQQSIDRMSVREISCIGSRQTEIQRNILLSFCSVIILLAFLCFVRIRNIVRPILHLTEMANLVMQNVWELPQWNHRQNDETGILVHSFYHMVHTIREQIDLLKWQQRLEIERKEANEKKLQLEYRNVQLELKALQNQINPHFLFNCINMIAKQAYLEEASCTQHITEAIARYLRSVLDQEMEIVTIERELQQIQNYLDIQMIRFGSRFQYQLNCEAECLSLYVPFMILQPLVENIFKHGIDCCVREIQLSCNIKRQKDSVIIYVEDNGPGMSEEQVDELRHMAESISAEVQTNGIGLINVFRRMQLYFQDQVEIFVESTPYTSTVIGFCIPETGLRM